MRRTIVVGGGISGLTAARELAAAGRPVLVLEATDRTGGKLRRDDVAGVAVDVGAEATINRRPEAVDLARELGLPVVHPTAASSRIWSRGALRPLPRTLMGAPLDLDQLAGTGILTAAGLERARRSVAPSPPDADVSVGDLVGQRFGDEVVDRLVEPLLGGVYAGHARAISVRAAVPQLLELATRDRFELPAPSADAPPVFAGVEGGMWRLAAGLTDALADEPEVELRTGTTVRGLRRTSAGWEVAVESGNAHRTETADAVVLAAPAAPTARILADAAPVAATGLATVHYASTALVTFALRPAGPVGEALDIGASGFLVPPVEGRRIKAATFSFAKWDWVRQAGDGLLILRTSLGRYGEERALQVADTELVRGSLVDLAAATGLPEPALAAAVVEARVQRWGGGLPQYEVGHLARVAEIRAALPEGLAACGAAYDGVGVAACVASGRAAARSLLDRPA